jgi:hypothetical protein
MNIKELRIGNLLLDHLGRILKVAGIKDDYIYCELSNGEKLKYNIKTFKPINLTEEFLLKFGFDVVYGWDDYRGFIKDEVEIECDYNYKEFTNFINKKIKYIHQIQNLYFSLTGNELTLNN